MEAIKANVIQQLSKRIEEEEYGENEDESDSESEEDCVLAEIEDSSSEEEEESEEEETAVESTRRKFQCKYTNCLHTVWEESNTNPDLKAGKFYTKPP